ncbi:MAG: hypothetical protein S4CHLAM6_13710 [Chlamydiae bacterium]|nr:hypothetical protein [Chlamydiota bacterium]
MTTANITRRPYRKQLLDQENKTPPQDPTFIRTTFSFKAERDSRFSQTQVTVSWVGPAPKKLSASVNCIFNNIARSNVLQWDLPSRTDLTLKVRRFTPAVKSEVFFSQLFFPEIVTDPAVTVDINTLQKAKLRSGRYAERPTITTRFTTLERFAGNTCKIRCHDLV